MYVTIHRFEICELKLVSYTNFSVYEYLSEVGDGVPSVESHQADSFNLVSDDPSSKYLSWYARYQRVRMWRSQTEISASKFAGQKSSSRCVMLWSHYLVRTVGIFASKSNTARLRVVSEVEYLNSSNAFASVSIIIITTTFHLWTLRSSAMLTTSQRLVNILTRDRLVMSTSHIKI